MPDENFLFKMSGDVIEDEPAYDLVDRTSRKRHSVVLVGGGRQINAAMIKAGFPICFGLLGREIKTVEEKHIVERVLKDNQAQVQDIFRRRRIVAEVAIPITTVGSVVCPVNGDIMLLSSYIGFDRLFCLTLKQRVQEKRELFQRIAESFHNPQFRYLDKLVVLGF